MMVGIVSDSHGKAERLAAALAVLTAHGVQTIVHCGDVGTTECMELLGRAPAPVHAVAGNMDGHLKRLARAAAEHGVDFAPHTVEVHLGDGQYLIATHGHAEDELATLIDGGQFPYVCCGHSHRQRDERIGNVRVINPGALHHPKGEPLSRRSAEGTKTESHPTVAVLDTDTDTLTFLPVG